MTIFQQKHEPPLFVTEKPSSAHSALPIEHTLSEELSQGLSQGLMAKQQLREQHASGQPQVTATTHPVLLNLLSIVTALVLLTLFTGCASVGTSRHETGKIYAGTNWKGPWASESDNSSLQSDTFPATTHISQFTGPGMRILVRYPETGVPAADWRIRTWANMVTNEFRKLSPQAAKPANHAPYTMEVDYAAGYPSGADGNVIGFVFNTYTYTGGAHGNTEITTVAYELGQGRPLEFADCFADPENALETIAAAARATLNRAHDTNSVSDASVAQDVANNSGKPETSSQLKNVQTSKAPLSTVNVKSTQPENSASLPTQTINGQNSFSETVIGPMTRWFLKGTAPVMANYSRWLPVKEGIVFFFPPYQVAPYAYGSQYLFIPLEALLPFSPNPAIWEPESSLP